MSLNVRWRLTAWDISMCAMLQSILGPTHMLYIHVISWMNACINSVRDTQKSNRSKYVLKIKKNTQTCRQTRSWDVKVTDSVLSAVAQHTHIYTHRHTHVAQAGISNQLILMLRYCRLYIINMGACSDNWSSGAGLLPGRNGMILFFGSFCPPSIGNLSSICI